jgi:exonuclease SbcC
MRPLRLSLQGLTRFTSRLDLDLSEAPPGIIAITGGNGEGKTTLLDALAPAALFRGLSTRPGSLKEHCNRRDSFIDLEMEFGGRTYRHKLTIDPDAAGGRGKEEAFLYEDGVPVTDRLAKAYDEAVERIYPSRAVFFASAFAAQNRTGNFLQLPMVERKELFATLLGLGHLQTLSERSGAGRRPLDAVAARLDEEAAALIRDQAEAVTIAAELLTAQAEVVALDTKASAAGEEAAAVRERVTDLRRRLAEANAERSKALERKRVLTAQEAVQEQTATDQGYLIERIERTYEAGIEQLRADDARLEEVTALYGRLSADYREANARLTGLEAEHRAAVKSATERAERLGKMGTTRLRLGMEREALAAVSARIEAAGDARGILARAQALLGEMEGKVRTERVRVATSTTEATRGKDRAALAVQQATRSAGLLDGVPCGGDVLFDEDAAEKDCGRCRFLSDARTARDGLDALRAELRRTEEAVTQAEAAAASLAELEVKLTGQRAEVDILTRSVAALTRDEGQAVQVRGTIRTLEEALADEGCLTISLAEDRGRVGELAETIADLRAKVTTLATEGAAAQTVKASLDGAGTRLQVAEKDLARLPLLRSTRDAALTRAEELRLDLADLVIPPPAEALAEEVRAVGEEQTAVDARHSAALLAARQARSTADRLHGRLDALGDLPARDAALSGRRRAVALRRVGFVLCEQGFGQAGIQALEIDAAGPEVSTIANQLLTSAFGGRFTLQLRTVQEAGRGKVQKEVFDIQVLDGQSGGARQHAALSGGEQVLVDEALKLSLAIFNARRAGAPFETLFRDEADGALSEEAAARYPEMLREAVKLGGFRNVYFITHRQTCAEQADARIVVKDGRAVLE